MIHKFSFTWVDTILPQNWKLKNCLSLLLFLSCSFSSFSQVNFGLKGGGNLSKLVFEKKYPFNFDSRFGFHAGLYSNYRVSNKFFLQVEALYSMKGYKFSSDLGARYDDNVNLDYISLPLLCSYKIGSKLAVGIGPQVSFLLLEKDKEHDYVTQTFRKHDFSAVADLSYFIGNGMGVNLRYDYGLIKQKKFYESTTSEIIYLGCNRTLQAGIFYQIKKD